MAYSLCMHCLDVIQCHIHMKASKGKNEWMQAGMDFLSYLYFGQSAESLSDLRHTLFTKKRGPPKTKSSTDHRICRAAYQTCLHIKA